MRSDLLYELNSYPFDKSWKEWAASWCKWMLSIPKEYNPSLDQTGKYCSVNQNDENVWFLTGTFGNISLVKRKCVIPAGKALFFPVLVKEDSFAEDSDLKTELDLIKRSTDATNRVVCMKAIIDGEEVTGIENYRVQSDVFDLKFPIDNVYKVRPGLTRSVCDGYWLFVKPLGEGKHSLYFKGETSLNEVYTLNQLLESEVYNPIWKHIRGKLTFRLEVSYDLTVL